MSFSNKKIIKIKPKPGTFTHLNSEEKFALHLTYLNIKRIIELTQKYYKI